MWASTGWKDYELLDCGKGEKLKKFYNHEATVTRDEIGKQEE